MAEPNAAPPLADVLRRAAQVWRLTRAGASLDGALERALSADRSAAASGRLRAAVQAVSYAAMRRRVLCERLIGRLAARPPDAVVEDLLTVALAQLLEERHAAHTVVDQAVGAARSLPATAAASGFVNAVLRAFLRARQSLVAEFMRDDAVRFNAPRWWIERVRAACPADAEQVLAAGLQAPPMVLRVNLARVGVDAYLERLAAQGMEATQVGAQAVWLHRPCPVEELPGFAHGDVSVQDAGAQLAAPWLEVRPGQRVLDACAAPGGKTGHLAELTARTGPIELTALEVDQDRARRIDQTLSRLGVHARVRVGDARDPDRWWDGLPLDRILLDAPCTASGIVRRHPDIPWTRRDADVAQLTTVQAQMLEALWPLLGVGGRLLYVVCSIFPQEGSGQIERFLQRHPEAVARPLPVGTSTVVLHPRSDPSPWTPGSALPALHDGFTYALLEKATPDR